MFAVKFECNSNLHFEMHPNFWRKIYQWFQMLSKRMHRDVSKQNRLKVEKSASRKCNKRRDKWCIILISLFFFRRKRVNLHQAPQNVRHATALLALARKTIGIFKWNFHWIATESMALIGIRICIWYCCYFSQLLYWKGAKKGIEMNLIKWLYKFMFVVVVVLLFCGTNSWRLPCVILTLKPYRIQ